MTARVILYSRPGCHLCDEARPVVRDLCAEAGVEWNEVDVDGDPSLAEEFGEMIPVVTVDGVVCGFWTIEAEPVRSALR